MDNKTKYKNKTETGENNTGGNKYKQYGHNK